MVVGLQDREPSRSKGLWAGETRVRQIVGLSAVRSSGSVSVGTRFAACEAEGKTLSGCQSRKSLPGSLEVSRPQV